MYNRNNLFILFIFVLVVLLSACRPAIQFDQPPEIRYSEDVCDECNMIISEARFAAAYYTKTGDVHRFDGVGEFCVYYLKHLEEAESIWVHDYQTEDWLLADQAFYIISPELQTPMGHGAVAVGDKARAEQLATSIGSEVMDFNGVLDHFRMAEDQGHNQ